ncbi:MAG TPA: class I SAM-dependent methyltransferase [Gaiellaceae bacterium]|nr:class I SAM-dependent methyltransferase [Gaiellaceae bacterium]
MTTRPRGRVRALAGKVKRRAPLRPLRVLFPFGLWRRLFRLWLAVIRAQPDREKAMRELLEVHDVAFQGMDRGAIDYDGGIHAKHRLTRYHDFFVERIRPGERVLDVGCHKGELAIDIAERTGATVVGIDRSPWALEQARGRFSHSNVTYVEADALAFAPDEPFDVVVLSNVLEHLGPRVEFLRGLRDRVGATCLLIRVPVLERDWTVPLRRELGLAYFSDPEHEVEYDVDLLRTELSAAGWEMREPVLAWSEIWAEARPAELSDA